MAFPADSAEFPDKKTGNLNEELQDSDFEEIKAADATVAEGDPSEEPPALKDGEIARSMVCDDCGKRFRSLDQAMFHRVKSGHENFSQSTEEVKPLTPEETKAKLEELKKKRDERKAQQAIIERDEARKNEKIKMKSTKEVAHIKEELEKKERLKEAKAKRDEKIADKIAKERIQAKIAADKEERRLKAEKIKAEREGRTVFAETSGTAPPPPKASTATEARLRLQTTSGNIMKTFPAETTLFEVAKFIEAENGTPVENFTLTYPKKVYSGPVDFGKSLKEAGLVPSAVLIVS